MRDTNSLLVARIRPGSWLSWDDHMIVIYLGDKVLLNAASYGRFGLRSPVHVAKCRDMSDRFAAEISASP